MNVYRGHEQSTHIHSRPRGTETQRFHGLLLSHLFRNHFALLRVFLRFGAFFFYALGVLVYLLLARLSLNITRLLTLRNFRLSQKFLLCVLLLDLFFPDFGLVLFVVVLLLGLLLLGGAGFFAINLFLPFLLLGFPFSLIFGSRLIKIEHIVTLKRVQSILLNDATGNIIDSPHCEGKLLLTRWSMRH